MSAWDREALTELRAAVARRDVAAIHAAVTNRDLDAVLQLAGDGLLVDPTDPLARRCAERLRRRGLEGDTELADALEPRPSDLRPLAVDLEELASILEGDPVHGGGRIDLTNGDIRHESPFAEHVDDEDLDDEDRWLWVEARSDAGWWDMSEFIETVDDPALADRLHRAIHGHRPFRRFRDELDNYLDQLTRFHLFADERQRGRPSLAGGPRPAFRQVGPDTRARGSRLPAVNRNRRSRWTKADLALSGSSGHDAATMRLVRGAERATPNPAVRLLIVFAVACSVPVAPAHGVVGGVVVAEETVPWFASWSACGGTLVAPDRVLTAGHCVRGRPLSELESIRVAGTVRRGVRLALHPGWRRRNGFDLLGDVVYPLEDVAVIQLEMPVTGVPPVSLGGPLPDRVTVLGRGMSTAPGEGPPVGDADELLRGAELRPITDRRCARDYRHRRGSENQRFHAAQMFCTTVVDGLPPLASACFGDSGGPLYSGPATAPVLHGIVSWGGTRCGADLLPTVYASVSRARRFITARRPRWAPVPNGPAVIAGRARPGRRLRCILPSWTVRPTSIRMRWDGWRLGGPATVGHGPTYNVRRRDVNQWLSCSVTASNAGGSVAVPDGPSSSVRVPRP